MMGLISRLAYGEIAERPETVRDAQRHTKAKMWEFFVAGFLAGLIFLGAMLAYIIVFGIVSTLLGVFLSQGSNRVLAITSIILTLALVLLFIFGIVWIISRLLLVELSLAVEEGVNATGTIGRSWELTKGSVGRIQLVVFIAFLITIPIAIAINILSAILQLAIGVGLENSSSSGVWGILATVLYIVFVLAASALIIPFWQSIKAVIYYDLRVRREGVGIDLKK